MPGTIVAHSGLEPHFATDGNSTVNTVYASPGKLFWLEVQNLNTADIWIQIYDESGTITVGTTTPVLSLMIPASDGTYRTTGGIDPNMAPIIFSNSIKYAVTTTVTGSGNVSSACVVNAAYSKG